MADAITTTVVREPDGRITVWVGDTQMLGAQNVQIVNSDGGPVLFLAVPSRAFRLSERYPDAAPLETKDNVVSMSDFRSRKAGFTPETPQTDGDVA
jgi:hypothetical protein